MAMVLPSSASGAGSCCFSASSSGPFGVRRRPCFLADSGVARGGRFCYESSPSSLVSSPRAGWTPEYTPSSPSGFSGPFVVKRRPCFLAGSGAVRGGRFCYESPPSSLACSPRAGSTPEYTPSSPSGSPQYMPLTQSQRSASPDYTPATPEYSPATPEYTPATPEYTPLSPSRCPASPDYTPASPPRRGRRAATPEYTPGTPEYTPGTPEYTPLSPSGRFASPDYTPESPARHRRRATTPEYTPSTLPPSPTVSDAESRTSSAPRRHHPYQRSQTSCRRHHRAFF